MNSLLYNLAVLLILFGVILMVHYTTKIYYQNQTKYIEQKEKSIYDSGVYQERPKTLFNKMFTQLGPWIGRTANPTDQELSQEDIQVQARTSPLVLFN